MYDEPAGPSTVMLQQAHSSEAPNQESLITTETATGVSLQMHDYFGVTVSEQISSFRYQYTQTIRDCKTIGTQTEGDSTVHHLKDATCQTAQNTEEKCFQINLPTLTYEDICLDDQKVVFYTGIPDKATFDALFDELKDDAKFHTSRRHISNSNCSAGGRPCSLRLIDEFFLVLMRLRLGLLLEDLGQRFCVSTTTCGDIFNRWVNYLHSQLSFLVMWAPREAIDSNMPDVFKEKFPTTRVVLD